MQRVDPGPHTVHWGFFDPNLEPVAEVEDGEIFSIRSVSGFPDDDVPADWIPPEIPPIHAQVQRGPGPHILTGPVRIAGAVPGDVLEVRIRSIRLGARYGYNQTQPLSGLLSDAFPVPRKAIFPIDSDRGIVKVAPGIEVPVHPFFGILGVAPPREWGRVDSRYPSIHGGNMDNRELVAGARLFLPVWVEGALFSAGDGHAAQGDGEVDLTAVETSLEGEFQIHVRKDLQLSNPMAVTPTHLITMGFHEDLNQAAKCAVERMIELLEQHYGIDRWDAYRLCSVAANLRVTQAVNPHKGIHVMLERSLLRELDGGKAFAS